MLWPKKSVEIYLTKPYIQSPNAPKETIMKPKQINFDPLNKYGIEYAAMTTHDISYYCERVNRKFSSIMYTYAGEAKLKSDKKTISLQKGSVFLSPKGSTMSLSIVKNWNVIWFHLDSTWRFVYGKNSIVQKGERLEEMKSVVQLYLKERYQEKPSMELLDIYAKLIVTYISFQFRNIAINSTSIGNITLDSLEQNDMTTKKLAKELKTTPYFINKNFYATNCKTFAKASKESKMKRAKELLAKMKIKDVAVELGYSTSQAFSRAFKMFFNESPRNYLKKLSTEK